MLGIFLIILNSPGFSQHDLEKKYDVNQYILDLAVSNSSTAISGNVIINASVAAATLDTFVVDLIDTLLPGYTYMVVDSVFIDGVLTGFQHHDHLVFIPLASPLSQDQLFSAQIFYHGKGTANYSTNYNGIGKKTYMGIIHTYTHSEPDWSKVWWPCKQILNDKADSVTFYITTDSSNITGSNGILSSTEILPGGKVKYKWETKYPIDFYLISFVVGPLDKYITYAQLPNTQDTLLLQNILFANSIYYPAHLKAIDKTKQLVYLFSELFGMYPFKDEKYGYSVIGTPLGAMEHQTMCTIGYQAMDTTSAHYYSYYFWYVAHELAHQWFGDYVTCSEWNYLWLNEGFASYMEYVALQHLESQAKADYWIQNAHNKVVSLPGGSVYVPDSLASDENKLFDYRLQYKKGASILHTLRYEINNDSLFFAVLRDYLSAYAYSVASAEDFKQIAETTTGIDFTDFFDQWYYGQGYPVFHIYWDQGNDTLTIESEQLTSSQETTLFKTHFDLKINSVAGDTVIRLFQETNIETYKIFFPETVISVEFDPEFWLIQANEIVVSTAGNAGDPFSFRLMPNPASDYIIVMVDQKAILQKSMISVYDIRGQFLFQQKILQNKTNLDISMLDKGVYLVQLQNHKNRAVLKFVKE